MDKGEELLIRGTMLSESVGDTASLNTGGQLWGPHLSTHHMERNQMTSTYYGERMFDALAAVDDDKACTDEHFANSVRKLEPHGFLSSSAVEDVLSLYNSDELMRLRSDLLEHLSHIDIYTDAMNGLDRRSIGTLRCVNTSSIAAMAAVRQSASYFVNSLLSSVVIGMTTESSANASKELSADDIISQLSQFSHHSSSDPGLNDISLHSELSISQQVRQQQSQVASMAVLSCYSTYSDDDMDDQKNASGKTRVPIIRIQAPAENYSSNDGLQRSPGSGEITLSSRHQGEVTSTTGCESPVRAYAFPKREIKRIPPYGQQSTSRDASPTSPIRGRQIASAKENTRASPELRMRTAPIQDGVRGEVWQDLVPEGAASEAPAPPLMRELPRRPKSQMASRYGGSKHRVLVDMISVEQNQREGSIVPKKDVPSDEFRNDLRKEWKHLSEGVFLQPGQSPSDTEIVHILDLSSGSASVTDDIDANIIIRDQDTTVVELKDTCNPTPRPPLVPSGLIVQGKEAAAAPIRGNMWRFAYNGPSIERTSTSIQQPELPSKIKSDVSIAFPSVAPVVGSIQSIDSIDVVNIPEIESFQSDRIIRSSPVMSNSQITLGCPLPRVPHGTNHDMHEFDMSQDDTCRADTVQTRQLSAAVDTHIPLVPPSPTQLRVHRPFSTHGMSPTAVAHSNGRIVRPSSVHESTGDREYVRLTSQPSSRSTRPTTSNAADDVSSSTQAFHTAPRTLDDIYKASQRPSKPCSAGNATSSPAPHSLHTTNGDRSILVRSAPRGGVRNKLSNPKGYVPKPPPYNREVSSRSRGTSRK